jgi:hypothetical protein
VADVSFVLLDELDTEVEQSLEVVGGVGNRPRLEPEPTNHLEDRLEVSCFLSLRVGIVVLAIVG